MCIFNKTCKFVRPGDARVTWRNAFDLHVEKYSGKNDCGERPLLCIFRHFGGLYLLKERCWRLKLFRKTFVLTSSSFWTQDIPHSKLVNPSKPQKIGQKYGCYGKFPSNQGLKKISLDFCRLIFPLYIIQQPPSPTPFHSLGKICHINI